MKIRDNTFVQHTRRATTARWIFLLVFLFVSLFPLCRYAYDNQIGFPFVDAARRGDVRLLKAYLKNGQHPDSFSYKGLKAINVAAIHGELASVRVLLQHGADPKQAFVKALVDGHVDVAREILQSATSKASRAFLSAQMNNALVLSANEGQLNSCAFLLKQGANINYQIGVNNYDIPLKRTALMQSLSPLNGNSILLFKFLISRGADISLCDAEGYTVRDVGELYENKKAIKYLATLKPVVRSHDIHYSR